MVSPQGQAREESIGSLLIPDRLASWAWTLGYTALIGSVLLFVRLPQLHGVMASLEHRTGVPVGAYVLAALYHGLGAGPVFLLQALGIGASYLLVVHIAQPRGAEGHLGQLVGVAALASPFALHLALGTIAPTVFVIAGTLGLAVSARHHNWTLFVTSGLTLLLCSNLGPLVLLLAAIPLWVERRLPVATIALVGAVVIAPVLRLVLGTANLREGLPAILLAGLPIRLAHPSALVTWAATSRGWIDVIWLLGPLVVLVVIAGRKILNAWWIPAVVLWVIQLAQGRGAFGTAGYAAAAFVFIASAVGSAKVNGKGRWLRLLLFAGPVLVAAAFLIINRHTLL